MTERNLPMKTIASFTVNHDTLQKGVYVSRIDGDVITYDIRMKKPNGGNYLTNGALHTFEHPYVKSTTKKYLFFLVPTIQLS